MEFLGLVYLHTSCDHSNKLLIYLLVVNATPLWHHNERWKSHQRKCSICNLAWMYLLQSYFHRYLYFTYSQVNKNSGPTSSVIAWCMLTLSNIGEVVFIGSFVLLIGSWFDDNPNFAYYGFCMYTKSNGTSSGARAPTSTSSLPELPKCGLAQSEFGIRNRMLENL